MNHLVAKQKLDSGIKKQGVSFYVFCESQNYNYLGQPNLTIFGYALIQRNRISGLFIKCFAYIHLQTKNPEPLKARDSLMAKEIIFSRSGIFSVPFRNRE